MSKIALGTAQFGMDYGINNKRGKIPREEVFEILNRASEYGIDTLDTAYAYGESETIIGEFIRDCNKKFKIISKLPKCEIKEVKNMFASSLKRLNTDMLYGYIIHSFKDYMENHEIWNILEDIKSDGKVKKTGFSVYTPDELDYLKKNKLKIDIIQVPYSIFDRRFERYFDELKNNGVEIHVRSVFLQGLVFKNPEELSSYFVKIKEKITKLNSLSGRLNVPIAALCLNFAVLNRFIDKVIVGVDSIENFTEIIDSSEHIPVTRNVYEDFFCFREDDEKIILPTNWNLN